MAEDILSSLISFFGVSGSEGNVRQFIKKQIKPYVHDIKVDRMGNLIAHKKGTGMKIMLAAHMDEIGLMVKRIEERGFMYVTAIGGIDPVAFIGNPVHVKTRDGKIHGFITTQDLTAGKYIEKLPTIESMFVDTGLTKQELNALGVDIGTPIFLESHACCTGKDIIFGKALDNRLGCYVLIELAKKLKKTKGDIYFVFTVQEEFGLFGAQTSSWSIEPDWGIAIDTTHANDVFPEPSRWLGAGPCITVKDGEFISNPCITGWLKRVAEENKIPYQLEATEEGTTDASVMQTIKAGVPTSVVCMPVRNIHTTSGIARMSDVKNTIKLLHAFLKNPPKKCIV